MCPSGGLHQWIPRRVFFFPCLHLPPQLHSNPGSRSSQPYSNRLLPTLPTPVWCVSFFFLLAVVKMSLLLFVLSLTLSLSFWISCASLSLLPAWEHDVLDIESFWHKQKEKVTTGRWGLLSWLGEHCCQSFCWLTRGSVAQRVSVHHFVCALIESQLLGAILLLLLCPI